MFAAMDGDAPAGSVTWLHTGASRAEAGFDDPTLGWVGVRADLGGGGVHASLVPGSAEAAQALGGHLAGLNLYLAERHAGVAPVTVASQEYGGAATNTPQGGGSESGAQSGSQSRPQQNTSGNPENGGMLDGVHRVSRSEERPARALPSNLASPAANRGPQSGGTSNGSYISVMA